MSKRLTCAYCGKPAQGNYSVHRDGFCEGPEVPLCNGCGQSRFPSLPEIWARISHTQGKEFASAVKRVAKPSKITK